MLVSCRNTGQVGESTELAIVTLAPQVKVKVNLMTLKICMENLKDSGNTLILHFYRCYGLNSNNTLLKRAKLLVLLSSTLARKIYLPKEKWYRKTVGRNPNTHIFMGKENSNTVKSIIWKIFHINTFSHLR
jgi:hypothetical protein